MREKSSPEERAAVLALVAKAWEMYPHMRLGQILLNLSAQGENTEQVLWNLDEYDLLLRLEDLLKHGWSK
jgi:ABC-type sugar transport system ATPase subunit